MMALGWCIFLSPSLPETCKHMSNLFDQLKVKRYSAVKIHFDLCEFHHLRSLIKANI